MHVPHYYLAQVRAEKQASARPPADDAPRAAAPEADREGTTPAGTPSGSLFDLGASVVRISSPFVLLLALAACDGCGARESVPTEKLSAGTTIYSDGFRNVVRIHDDEAEVTCWAIGSHGLHCLPDSQVRRDR